MTKLPFIRHRLPRSRRGRNLALAAGVVVLLLAVISCSTVNRQAVVLPDVPGAKYIGSDGMRTVPRRHLPELQTADHARLIAPGNNALNVGCESCHGPCSLHSDSGGDIKPPYSFTAGRPEPEQLRRAACRSSRRARRKRSVTNATRCARTVSIARPSSGARRADDLHRVPCAAQGLRLQGGGTALLSENEMCLRCHPAQQGPLRV